LLLRSAFTRVAKDDPGTPLVLRYAADDGDADEAA
jgi:hypothetical protein